MDRFDTLLVGKFREKAAAEIEQKTARLVSTPASDHADYRERVGTIKGLRAALEILDLTINDLGRDKPSTPEEKKRATGAYEA